VRFWDTSAIVPLVVRHTRSSEVEAWLSEDSMIAAWTLTPTEMLSAVHRLGRESHAPAAAVRAAERVVADIISRTVLITDVERVKTNAERLLRTHALRAADALQLGAALAWASDRSRQILHTFDARLRHAAEREGFRVIPDA